MSKDLNSWNWFRTVAELRWQDWIDRPFTETGCKYKDDNRMLKDFLINIAGYRALKKLLLEQKIDTLSETQREFSDIDKELRVLDSMIELYEREIRKVQDSIEDKAYEVVKQEWEK